MGYLYENSNPDRFQHFCQSLLILDFPKLQCYPIGQPDGGRDGWDPDSKTVLQVKFKRTNEEENAEWLIETLENELPKIIKLAERGAQAYIIATNAQGTAHLDGGRIDKVQKWLDDNLPIRGVCFWRDELDRRFDKASKSLKLKYSELLSLEDGIEVALGAVLGEDKERQKDALRGFIVTQFETDKTVKFKQVSLSNDLLDLFVDVPVGFPRKMLERSSKGSNFHHEELRNLLSAISGENRAVYFDQEGPSPDFYIESATEALGRRRIGTAELLLSNAAQDNLRLVVLEGAPGQGKSTLAQYVCQIHRARYLKKQEILARVPDPYKQTAFRIPIKVDLRDYAAFLDGHSPFVSTASASEPRTLEVFLAQLIFHNSGGMQFTPNDVLSLLKSAPALLFLDGLDEVADINAREALVTSIGEATARWKMFDADLQVVITSRPSVFGRAPSFKKFGFVTLNLQNIDSKRVNEYADKWIAARGLNESEKHDVKKILGEKLELAHIRDLTRNPMQLTILLSLIHQIGHSLPDQRTDLYSRYVDLFLTREADKSAKVRENRQVLLGFIQHLAWYLQTQAESSKAAGSITAENLQEVAQEYLQARGHPISIAEDLFGGGLERIFVLVERIEGLYEFEVQPLREFFCAQHLYTTAPVGTYRDTALRGDRAQRFEALAANPFWLNVCRFYAGSCARGETGTLVLSLEEMIKTRNMAVSSQARRVGLALLQDWVFSNVKYPQDALVRAVFEDPGAEIIMASDGRGTDELRLDIECGRNTLRDLIFAQLQEWPVDIRTSQLCYVLRNNGGQYLGQKFCDLINEKSGDERTFLLLRMFRAGAVSDLPPEEIWNLITADEPSDAEVLGRISELVWAEPLKAARIPEAVSIFIRAVLNGQIVPGSLRPSPLGIFADLLGNSSGTYAGLRWFAGIGRHGDAHAPLAGMDAVPSTVGNFIDAVSKFREESADAFFEISESPGFWNAITESARSCFGESWATMSLAIRAAGIKANVKLPDGANQLFDPAVPLCSRARSARLRRGGNKWWLEQLENASSNLDQMLWAGLVIMWSSVSNLYQLAEQTNTIVDRLSDTEYNALLHTLSSTASHRDLRADRKKATVVDLRPFSARTSVLVASAFGASTSILQYTREQERSEPLRSYIEDRKEYEDASNPPSWKDTEKAFAWAQRVNRLRNSGMQFDYGIIGHLIEPRFRTETATLVLENTKQYPLELVTRAVMYLQRRYKPKALATIAQEQNWSFD